MAQCLWDQELGCQKVKVKRHQKGTKENPERRSRRDTPGTSRSQAVCAKLVPARIPAGVAVSESAPAAVKPKPKTGLIWPRVENSGHRLFKDRISSDYRSFLFWAIKAPIGTLYHRLCLPLD